MGEAGVGAAQVAGHVPVPHGEAAHVGLVDDGVRPGGVRPDVLPPGEEAVDDHRPGHVRLGVEVADVLVAGAVPAVAEELGTPGQVARDRLGVGVDEQLVGVVAQPVGGRVAAVDPEAVVLARPHPVDVAMPVQVGALGELEGGRGPSGAIEEHQLDPVGGPGEQREVGPLAIPRRPQRDVAPRPGRLHGATVWMRLIGGHDRWSAGPERARGCSGDLRRCAGRPRYHEERCAFLTTTGRAARTGELLDPRTSISVLSASTPCPGNSAGVRNAKRSSCRSSAPGAKTKSARSARRRRVPAWRGAAPASGAPAHDVLR